MWESKLKFLTTGLQTLILDHGRTGQQSYGVPQGGVLDVHSATIANQLVGNGDNNPVIEMTMLGPKIEVKGDIYIAVTGAPIPFKINSMPQQYNETIHVADGSTISFGSIQEGMRSYLAINGKWQTESWLNSVCSIPNYSIPQLKKNRIIKNDELKISTNKLVKKRTCPVELQFNPQEKNTVRILKGPEFSLFKNADLEFFLNTGFTVHPNSNRMAISFNEVFPNYLQSKELISSANILGTIQITKKGEPLILLNDAGTTGGYPRIGNVISVDLPKLAQIKSGSQINFELVDIDFAQRELSKQKELLLSFS